MCVCVCAMRAVFGELSLPPRCKQAGCCCYSPRECAFGQVKIIIIISMYYYYQAATRAAGYG